MSRIMKVEISRALRSRGMALALGIGCLIAIGHVVQYQIPSSLANFKIDFGRFPTVYPSNVSDMWLEGNAMSVESFVYFLVVPILAALPFGASYFGDRKSGFLKGMYMRLPRKKYLSAKYAAVFLSGGMAVVLPLVLNLLCALVLLPNLEPPVILRLNGINPLNTFYQVYFSHPLLYILIFLCIDFLLGGIFACVCLAASFISDYQIIVLLCPFFLQLGIHIVLTILGTPEASSVQFAMSGTGLKHLWVFGIYLVVGIFTTLFIFKHKGEREDVF